MDGIFNEYGSLLEKEGDLREKIRSVVKDIEQVVRSCQTLMDRVQSTDSSQTQEICSKATECLSRTKDNFAQLQDLVPADQFYRFHGHWREVMTQISFIAAYVRFLQSDELISLDDVEALIGLEPVGAGIEDPTRREAPRFHVDLEAFLIGLCSLSNELGRLAVNAVTRGDYGMPRRIARFLGELNGGFRLLNLRNDLLRKRFDSTKYDLKKVEEVLYDVSIRGLTPSPAASASATPLPGPPAETSSHMQL